jgi:hypothetical protein
MNAAFVEWNPEVNREQKAVNLTIEVEIKRPLPLLIKFGALNPSS